LESAELVSIREAATCEALNSQNIGIGIITASATQFADDCPIGRTRLVTR
jgi:hypothetical protein